MPTESTERTSRLREEENPPYPEYVVGILRSALDIQQDIGGMKHAIQSLEATTKKQADALEEIGRGVRSAKVTIRVLIGVIIAAAAVIGWLVTSYLAAHPGK